MPEVTANGHVIASKGTDATIAAPSRGEGADKIMSDDLAGPAHWDKRSWPRRLRMPSRSDVGNAGLLGLLDSHVTPGCRVLEVGCAPGGFLLWCALTRKAHACGVDYAEKSCRQTLRYFADAAAAADIRQEDIMQTSFEPGSFDVVYSLGVVEHYSDPAPMVQKHLELLKPGGIAIITVPNYGPEGIYGWLKQRLSPETYRLHNISIMTVDAMLALSPDNCSARAYAFGRLAPGLLSLQVLPRPLGGLLGIALNLVGLMQPTEIRALRPWLVLELRRR
ncbi:MAG TPA: class I SAM-dependent methyltransferase [Bradyrhizobium sp.]|jgi:2-polyprenyl-3-methyl-5-hydroxy-6-metoxy-1,4-benzoquinol methylase|nr:class I SAM-dependent methyltransferase [Bradyrhizobium sp.]